eukprot:746515-Pyramimonas_sp.AAC.1
MDTFSFAIVSYRLLQSVTEMHVTGQVSCNISAASISGYRISATVDLVQISIPTESAEAHTSADRVDRTTR